MRPLLPLLCALALTLPVLAHGQSVALAGVLGSKALLVIDGGAPRALAVGQAASGVTLLAVGADSATITTAGGRQTLYLGEAPVSVGSQGAGMQRLLLHADARGHFTDDGAINGHAVRMLVDTGASVVSLDQALATRLGLRLEGAEPVRMATANGTGQGWRVRLDSVRIGALQLRGVDAIVTAQPMPFVLLGNNFLTHFEMSRSGSTMLLMQRP